MCLLSPRDSLASCSCCAQVAAVAVGLGEIFMIVSAQVLIASEAPRGVRGSVSGLFSLLGSVSILVTSFVRPLRVA